MTIGLLFLTMNLLMFLILMMSLLMVFMPVVCIKRQEKQMLTIMTRLHFQPAIQWFQLLAFHSRDDIHIYSPFAKLNKCWLEKNALVTILDEYDCNNKAFQADGLQQHISTQHSKLWCGMGVQIFLQELYPEPT